jgi:membrane glycosyltransferase
MPLMLRIRCNQGDGAESAPETANTMVATSHVIEADRFSARKVDEAKRVMQLRRVILIGLAAAMTLATLAPIVVLAG